MPVGATIGAAVIGGGASLIGSASAAAASKAGLKQQLSEFNQVQGEAKPYISGGQTAMSQIDNPNTIMSNFQQSPGYQWSLNQGMNQVLQNKAVNGLLGSGSALSGLGAYVTGAASQDYNNWFNNNLNVAKVGESALYPSGNAASGASNAIGTNAANQGNADITTANQVGSLTGSLASIMQQYGGGANGGAGTSSFSSTAPGGGGYGGPADAAGIAGIWGNG